MGLTVTSPSMANISHETIADFAESTAPTDVDYVSAAGLMFVRDPAGTAVTTADGALWSPAGSVVSPLHFGAVGDGVTDDQSAVQKAVDFLGVKALDSVWYTDVNNTFGAGQVLDGLGKTYAIGNPNSGEGAILFTDQHKGLVVRDMTVTAIGSWPLTSEISTDGNPNPEHVFDCKSGATYVTFDNCLINCNNLSGGIRIRNRGRVINSRITKCLGLGILTKGGDVWVDQCIIDQWGQSDPEYYNPAKYTGVGIRSDESDVRVTNCVIRWMKKLAQFEGTNHIIETSHIFNGMRGYLLSDRSTDPADPLNVAIAAEIGQTAAWVASNDLPRRTEHIGIEFNKETVDDWIDGGMSGTSPVSDALALDDVYMDNLHNEFYTDNFSINNPKCGSKPTSSLNTSASATDPTANTPYGDTPTIDYWFRAHCPFNGQEIGSELAGFETFVDGASRFIIRHDGYRGQQWAATTNVVDTDPVWNTAGSGGSFKPANGTIFQTAIVHMFDGAFRPAMIYRTMGDEGYITFVDDTTTGGTLGNPDIPMRIGTNKGVLTLESDNGVVIEVTGTGDIIIDAGGGANNIEMRNLPTSNPGGSDIVWNNAGVMNIT